MTRSVYQSNGKPLSQTAIYQQRLKQGVYTSPGVPSVGVNSSASDTAALLAASTDLTVRPSYERLVAHEAHLAANAAKTDGVSVWSRGGTDPNADAAAANARISETPTLSSKTGVPAYKGSDVYKVASQNSLATMTSRTTPEKNVSRHGLATKLSATLLNINKISQVANKNSSKSLNQRFNPELDYRSGLGARPIEHLTADEETLAAEGAAASLKHGGGYADQASSQIRTKTFRAVDVVDAALIAAANKAASDRLASLLLLTPVDFKAQAQQYAHALTVAQKNSEERIRNNKAGLLDVGGGLTVSQSEINKLAALIVGPVLSDISTKAALQRLADKLQRAKHGELARAHEKAKEEKRNQEIQEKLDLEEAKRKRVKENEIRKSGEDEKYLEYQNGRNEEVRLKVLELKELEKRFAEEKEKLLAEKQANQDRIDEEETGLVGGRKDELDTLQTEKDAILKPTLDELEEETSKLKTLTDAHEGITAEATVAEKLHDENKLKVAELQAELEATKADIEKYTKDLETSTARHEETSKEVDALKETHSGVLTEAESSHKDLDAKLEELSRTKEEHAAAKIQQKKEINQHLDDKVKEERKINQELPEHLREDVDETHLRDTGSLFTVERASIKELPIASEEDKKAAAKVDATVAKSSTKPISPPPTNQKRRSSLRAKLSLIFVPPPKAAPVKKESASVKKSSSEKKAAVTEDVVPEKESAAKVEPLAQPPATKPVSKTASISEASNGDFEDDLSINKGLNRGGLFKEEI